MKKQIDISEFEFKLKVIPGKEGFDLTVSKQGQELYSEHIWRNVFDYTIQHYGTNMWEEIQKGCESYGAKIK